MVVSLASRVLTGDPQAGLRLAVVVAYLVPEAVTVSGDAALAWVTGSPVP